MIPSDLLSQIDQLVQEGRFPDRETAVAEVLRLGLLALRDRAPTPPRPPMPPGRREPHDDRPMNVDPTDVNWMP